MPVTVRGTDILFNDGSTQNTAAGAVNTTTVLNATAGASVGAVGTYAFLAYVNSPQPSSFITPGQTYSGSALRYANSSGQYSGTLSGTWRSMGQIVRSGQDSIYGQVFYVYDATLFLRIS